MAGASATRLLSQAMADRPSPVRCACIDIGSNTTRLLVADAGADGLREVLSRREFTALRAPAGTIPAAKVASVAAEVAEQARLAREAGSARVITVATAAVRDAPNRDELCDAVRAASGETVRILSCEDEARLAFLGATRTLDEAPPGALAVVDVGGGSTELVLGTFAEGVSWSTSFPVGSGVLADLHLASDPPTAAELDAVRAAATAAFDGVTVPRPDLAYAVGGSATSLRGLLGSVLDHDSIVRGVSALCAEPAAEVADRLRLDPERVRVLPAGMLLLDAAAATLDVALQIATGGLREGVLLECLEAPLKHAE